MSIIPFITFTPCQNIIILNGWKKYLSGKQPICVQIKNINFIFANYTIQFRIIIVLWIDWDINNSNFKIFKKKIINN